MTALTTIRIVELAESVSGEYCAKLLADFGADVIKIERPATGSPTRHMAPLVDGASGVEASGLFAYLNSNKRSLTLDLDRAEDREHLYRLIEQADAVVDDHDPEWLADVGLSHRDMEKRYPDTVFCTIGPWGRDTPNNRRNAKSINIFHDSGWGYHTPSSADAAKPPLKGPGRFNVDYEAGLEAATCVLSALYWRDHGGAGQRIDISMRDVMVSRADLVLGRLLAGEDQAGRDRTAYDQAGPSDFFGCADGAVYLYITNQKHWRGLQELMGDPAWMKAYDENWLEFGVTRELVAEFRRNFRDWVASQHRNEISERAQRLGIPLVPVNDCADLYQSPQFSHRGFFHPLPHPTLGTVDYPTVPYRMSGTPATLSSPAPTLDQHQGASFRQRPHTAARVKPLGGEAPLPSKGPLAGVRVLEISKVWAGPYAGKMLAFLGAEVIKVESHTNMDELRAFGGVDLDNAPYFLSVNQEVLSIQANMKTEEGLSLVRDLIGKSDIVLNNLRPGAMERMNLGYEQMAKIKPDIISVSIKMFGNDGPLGHQTGYAPCFAALGGLSSLAGYEGEPPAGVNMRYGDSTVGANAVFASLVALMHRERTGEGQFVDISAVECMAAMAGDSLMQYALTGEVPRADGNRHSEMAPHGCYPCADGEWLAIAVAEDGEWRQLCQGLGEPALAENPRYATRLERLRHAAELDEHLARLTAPQDAGSLAARLRSLGVAACKSLSSLDLIAEESLWDSGAFTLVNAPDGGTRPVMGNGWHFSVSEKPVKRGAPRLGEHNHYVYGELLGLSTEKIESLIAAKVIY